MKTEKQLEAVISGIKCDNPNCNYRDDSVKFEDYPQWIDKACPVCAWNLLTKECYAKNLKLLNVIDVISNIGHVLKWINPFFLYRKAMGIQKKPFEGHKVWKQG